MNKTLSLLLLWLLGLPVAQANLLQDFLAPVQAFKARFVQRSLDEQGRVQSEDSGWMLLARPNRFHWQVEAPFPQLILSDGKQLWQVDPELNQATVQPLTGNESSGWLWVWTHPDRLEERFEVEEKKQAPGTGQLHLRARQEEGVQSLILQFDAGQPVRIVSRDALGGTVAIELSRLEINPAYSEEDFQFDPPAGMDVLQQDELELSPR